MPSSEINILWDKLVRLSLSEDVNVTEPSLQIKLFGDIYPSLLHYGTNNHSKTFCSYNFFVILIQRMIKNR